MTRNVLALLGFLTSVSLESTSALAQKPNAPAELMAVTKGVFTLKVGQSIDLTDRGILLHLSRVNADSSDRITGVAFTINGSGGSYSVGVRRDLKTERSTMDFVKDLRSCFLDLVSAIAPQGGPASATFRLLCP
jgi:hypothetical protein